MAASAEFRSLHATILRFFAVLALLSCVNAQYYFAYQTVEDCANGPTDQYHEMYDISQLRCLQCAQETDLQTVSADGEL